MVMVKAPAYRAQVFLGPVEVDALVVNKQISQNDAAVLRGKQIKFKVNPRPVFVDFCFGKAKEKNN